MVIKANTCHAFVYNAFLLGITPEMICDANCFSPFAQGVSNIREDSLPLALRPTKLQRSTRHYPWIDVLPLPRMRDNMIRACQVVVDEVEIASDIMNVGVVCGDKATMVVWGDPSDPGSWEASVAFLRKWGYLLRGCQELIDATNYWRGRRGETTLRVDVS